MTNPFDSFAFSASGSNQSDRTLRDRLADIHNVKDYGAKGDGVTDDWAAIMAALNWNRYFVTTTASNLVASFTGVITGAAFNGTISGNNLTINGPIIIVPLGIGAAVWGQGVPVCAIVGGSNPNWVINGSPHTVGPIPMQTDNATFSGTVSGNNLTVNSGAAGTVAVGQTIVSGATSCKIISGSGPSWVVDGSPQTVTADMTTNTILTASSVIGSINVGDYLLNNGGTDASPSAIFADTRITSSQGSGVYILNWPVPFHTITMQVFTSQAMMTVSSSIAVTPSIQIVSSQNAFDVNNLTVAGDGNSRSVALTFGSGSPIVFQSMGGLVNSGDSIGVDLSAGRGIIYFSPGNYLVSKPINFTASQTNIVWRGCLAASTITGNFNDYVFSQHGPSETKVVIERLNVVNIHATGGGIRLGSSEPGAVRSCAITAYRGISDYNDDIQIHGGAFFGSVEFAIEDCTLTGPGGTTAGSAGVMRQSDGPVTNCRIVGYETGLLCAGGEGAQVLLGNYFEKCTTGVLLGTGPDGSFATASGVVIAGCWFKNCSTAIYGSRPSSLCTLAGLLIEGTNGQAPGGGNPQYGILSGQSTAGLLVQSLIAGVNVVGTYAVAGIYFNGSQGPNFGPTFMGVADNSSSPSPFFLDPTSAFYLPTQIACNARHIYTVAQLPASGMDASQELNVSDGTNGLGWGVTVTGTGTHTTPYLVQWNGTSWTVVGK